MTELERYEDLVSALHERKIISFVEHTGGGVFVVQVRLTEDLFVWASYDGGWTVVRYQERVNEDEGTVLYTDLKEMDAVVDIIAEQVADHLLP